MVMLDQRMTVGRFLQRERESRKISLESVSKGTRIKSDFLQALEEDAFHILPAEAYVLGFLKCYAKFIHLDPAEVVNLYRNQTEPEKNQFKEKGNNGSPIKREPVVGRISPLRLDIALHSVNLASNPGPPAKQIPSVSEKD